MERRRCGTTDLSVSSLGLGTWTWSALPVGEAERQLGLFTEAGGCLVDTAPNYGDGRAEEMLGTVLSRRGRRDDLVLATKAGAGPEIDTSRAGMLRALDGSLRRLRADHVDLWQIHLWNGATPLEETLEALDHAVREGKARHVGVSNYRGWQLARAATVQQFRGGAPIATDQIEYSLVTRSAVEEEIGPAARALGTGLLAWGPLAGGLLTGKYRSGRPVGSRASTTTSLGKHLVGYLGDAAADEIVSVVVLVAGRLGLSPAQVALAWARDRPAVCSAIMGARSADQLDESLRTPAGALPSEVRDLLDEVSAY
jgi:aryl-alcohol dehydrogenase-like predicted oxidoreductase